MNYMSGLNGFCSPTALQAALQANSAPQLAWVGAMQPPPPALLAGSRQIGYAEVTAARPPAQGLMPEPEQLIARLHAAGIDPTRPLVAYDMGGSGQAARLVFALAALGNTNARVLDGGLTAWLNAGLPTVAPAPPEPLDVAVPDIPAAYNRTVVDRAELLQLLGRSNVRLLDTRTAAEYSGQDVRAARGGHIPGAIHLNWVDVMQADGTLRGSDALRSLLADSDVLPEHEVIVYCQTHHRSAHTWVALRHLGYENVRGYAGAWSDWGNQPDTPIEL